MIINKIKLENIRSYLNEEIVFPEGSVLLSGDIGSGKSSVLLAVEFALFGLEKGGGIALLRNGKDKGSVELHFELDNKEVIIKRALKRDSKGVSQGSGFIIFEGKKEEGMATELKARVLKLLTYPKEYLTKSKGLIYKYTVYTPQEEMKRILMESKDNRLEVLRKVFDIDKYKRIRENSGLFLRYLRAEMRVGEERLKDLEVKEKERKEKEGELEREKKELEKIEEELRKIKKEVGDKKKALEIFEIKVKEYNELRNKRNLIERDYEYKLREREKLEGKIRELRGEVVEEEENFEDLKKEYEFKLDVVKKNVGEFENNLDDVKKKLSGFKAKEEQACEIKNNIKDLDKCPTCFQEVKQEYKNRIFENQDEVIQKVKEEIEVLIKLEDKYRDSLVKNKERLEDLNRKLNEVELRKIRFENNQKKKEELIKNETELRNVKGEVAKLKKEGEEISKRLEDREKVEEGYSEGKLELENMRDKEREIEIRKSGREEKIKFYLEELNKLKLEIEKLKQLEIKVETVKKIEVWLDKHFLSLMGTIEKNVMFRLYNEFNELFQKWFGILNESLEVRLDEEFTPVISQEGYNIEYSDLSGGERTAVALAYRLSLNQVINNLIVDIKTRDLLILDEPTEGFSTEQLDRVRVVLDELDIRQVIIVSHEAKVESFVDKVLKFEKINGVSGVVG